MIGGCVRGVAGREVHPPISVVVGVIRQHGKWFFIQQRPEGSPAPGFWEMPGGKIEDGELLEEALKRELREELNASATIHEYLGRVLTDDGRWLLNYFLVDVDKIEMRHAKRYAWVNVKTAKNYNLLAPDIAIMKRLTMEPSDETIKKLDDHNTKQAPWFARDYRITTPRERLHADLARMNKNTSLLMLKWMLDGAWSRGTSSDPDRWEPGNPAWGQCAITALIIQDVFGGELVKCAIAAAPAAPSLCPNMVAMGECGNADHVAAVNRADLDAPLVEVSHYWNRIESGEDVDLTRQQFANRYALVFEGIDSTREYVLSFTQTRIRYEALSRKLVDVLGYHLDTAVAHQTGRLVFEIDKETGRTTTMMVK